MSKSNQSVHGFWIRTVQESVFYQDELIIQPREESCLYKLINSPRVAKQTKSGHKFIALHSLLNRSIILSTSTKLQVLLFFMTLHVSIN